MKSISSKLSLSMILCTLVAVAVVSFIHVGNIAEMNHAHSEQILELLCEDSARAMDAELAAVERSVDLLAQHSSSFLSTPERPIEASFRDMKLASLSTSSYTDEVFAVYFHANPELYDESVNYFYVRDKATGAFLENAPDDPYQYEALKGQPADWFFASFDSGEARWLDPYANVGYAAYDSVITSSYTVPVWDSVGQIVGVLGMDFTLDSLNRMTEDIHLYDTGYAFLTTADGVLVDHPIYPFGTEILQVRPDLVAMTDLLSQGDTPLELYHYDVDGVPKLMTFCVLRNGMRLAVTVPQREVNAAVHQMMGKSLLLLCVVLITSAMGIYCLVYQFIHPLQRLTHASQQIIRGNMQVELPYHAPDEIGELTENFRQMTTFLQQRIDQINAMAYTDTMTGLKNKAAYETATALLQERMTLGMVDFGVVVFDLNNLKRTNDEQGHEAGDVLIKRMGELIVQAFAHSPAYRIGGDEFVALLEKEDLRAYDDCAAALEKRCMEMNQPLRVCERISFAYGMARYDATQDHSYSDVFARADHAMYVKKNMMKRAACAS